MLQCNTQIYVIGGSNRVNNRANSRVNNRVLWSSLEYHCTAELDRVTGQKIDNISD